MANETTPVAVRQLNALAQYATRLPEIIDAANKTRPQITLKGITGKIAADLGIPDVDLRNVFLAIDQIRSVAEKMGGLDKAVERLLEFFGTERLANLVVQREAIVRALANFNDDNPAALSLKARKITFMHENLLSDAEILTDARPIYNNEGTKVVKWVITHSLVLTYQSFNEQKRTYVTLDHDDILKIRKACDRAVIKGSTLKEVIGEDAQVLTDDAFQT